jgi:CRISPR-associated endoribonuclease Cas6
MDLLSLVLTLKPLNPPQNPPAAPAWWGRAAHALLLNTVRQVDENLAADLHSATGEGQEAPQASGNAVRPFTTSTLMGHFNKGTLDPQSTYGLRLTAFRADLATILETASTNGMLAAGQTIELDYQPFEVLSVQPIQQPAEAGSSSPWAGSNSYQDLSAPYLLAKIPAPKRISLQFTSPTTFKSGGRHVPVPLPGLVFGSLLERWNAWSPVSFPVETRRYAEECLAISKFDLETRPVPQKSRGLRVGAVGSISYTTINHDRYWMSVLAVLAHFSLFCGVGAGASAGLGQCRMLPETRMAAE